MAATMIFRLKLPPDGGKWCLLCARLYKGSYLQLPAVKAKIELANEMDPSKVVYFDGSWPIGSHEPMLNEAVAVFMMTQPVTLQTPVGSQVQPMTFPCDVCWTHLDGLIQKEGVLAYSQADMPHERGAVDLGARRRAGG